jgi:hypothetical protein
MGVLKTAYTGQIRCTVAAPITQETRNLGLPVVHLPLLKSSFAYDDETAKNPKLPFSVIPAPYQVRDRLQPESSEFNSLS